MPLTRRLAMGVITHRVRCCDPAKEPTHFAVLAWLQNQVPMVGQQLIRQDRNFLLLQPFGKDSLERRKVFVIVKNRQSSASPVETMVKRPHFIRPFGFGQHCCPNPHLWAVDLP
jgi:hypothetical protein